MNRGIINRRRNEMAGVPSSFLLLLTGSEKVFGEKKREVKSDCYLTQSFFFVYQEKQL